MSSALATRLARDHAGVADTLPAGVVGAARRRAALEELLARGLPTSRDENWHYANLRALERVAFGAAASAVPELGTLAATLPATVPGFLRLLVIDGVLRSDLTPGLAAPAGVSLSSARSGTSPARPAAAPADASADSAPATDSDERFALLNEAFALDEIVIRAAGLSEPGTATDTGDGRTTPAVELVYVSTGRGAAYPRARIELAAGATLRLLEWHVGGSGTALTNAFTAITLGRAARLEHYRVEGLQSEATWIDTLDAVIGQGAHYGLHQYAVGARAARSTLRIALAEPEAAVDFHAATLAAATQVIDTYARIEHAAPRSRSTQNFRAIAGGRGRVAFNGHIVVRPGARGADSRQSLRSLITGAEAEVDARPQLEIYTDDVKCSHGATAGKLDETMLFYLLSRGISRETAQSLLKWAFLEDTVAHIADGALRAALEAVLENELKDPTIAAGRRE